MAEVESYFALAQEVMRPQHVLNSEALGVRPFLTDPGARRLSMSTSSVDRPLQPGDRAPNVVLNAISHEGKIALDEAVARY